MHGLVVTASQNSLPRKKGTPWKLISYHIIVEAGVSQREVGLGMKALWEEEQLQEKRRREDEEDGAGRVGRTWPTQPRRR